MHMCSYACEYVCICLCAYVHGCTSECVHMCMVAYLSVYMCVRAHVSVCGHGGQRTTLPITPRELSTLVFGTEPLTVSASAQLN